MSTKEFRFAAFAGRRRELASLLDLGKRIEQGRGAIVLVDGEHGVGKTRLVQQFLLEHGGGADAFAMGSMPMLLLGSWPVDTQTVREVPHLDPAEIETRRDRPTVLVFDDMGSASKSLLRSLERAAHLSLVNPWLIVATYENNFVDGARNGLARVLLRLIGLGAMEISLEPLPAGDMRLLLHSASHSSVSRGDLEHIQRTSRGNPMYAGELLRRAGDQPGVTRPLLSLADAIGRVSDLDADAKDVLNAASVLGDHFEESHLCAMVKLPEETLVRVLDRLVALRAIEPDTVKGSFTFCSGVDRAAIYEALLPAHRRLLHASAADVFLRASPGRPVDLAWHAYAAQLPASPAYIVQAAQSEQRRGRFDETLRLLRAGMNVAGSEHRKQFVESLANAMHMGAAGYHSIKPLLDELQNAESPPPVEELAERYQRMLMGLLADCDGEGARRAAEEALGLPPGPSPVLMQLRMVVARVLSMLDRHDQARAVLSGVPVPEPDDVQNHARYALALAVASRASDDHLACLNAFKDAIAALWDRQPFGAVMSAATLATLLYQHGDLDSAWNVLQSAIQTNADLGERGASTASVVALTAAELCIMRGDVEGARDAIGPALGEEEVGTFSRVDLTAKALAVGAAMRDDLLLASFENESMLEIALRSGLSDLIGHVTYGFCELYAYRGQPAKLRSVISRVLDASPAVDKCYHIALCAARYGSAEEVMRAKKLIAGSPWRMPFAKSHVTLFRAFVASRAGQRTEALRLSQRAWESYDTAGWKTHAAIARSIADGKRSKSPEAPKNRLTAREAEVVRLASEGKGNEEIAAELNISPKTVGNHLMAAFAKLDVHSRRELKYHIQ